MSGGKPVVSTACTSAPLPPAACFGATLLFLRSCPCFNQSGLLPTEGTHGAIHSRWEMSEFRGALRATAHSKAHRETQTGVNWGELGFTSCPFAAKGVCVTQRTRQVLQVWGGRGQNADDADGSPRIRIEWHREKGK